MADREDILRELFVTGLRNAHAVEHQAVALLDRQIERLDHYPDLSRRLKAHRRETDRHIARLDSIFGELDEKPSTLKDTALTLSGNLAALAHTVAGDEVIKNSLASFAFENFEAASYASLITIAEAASMTLFVADLRATLDEEIAMANWLSANLAPTTQRFIALSLKGTKADR